MSADRPRVVIVGGGYSAAALAVQLVRRTRVPVDITIIEPRENLGRGLAYSATDPEHRLNGPLDTHALDPDRPRELRAWCQSQGLLEQDPECFARSGHIFLRRGDFGKYLSDQLACHARDERLGSRITHVRDVATSVVVRAGLSGVETAEHGMVQAHVVVIATGNSPPRLPFPFKPEHGNHPRVIAQPLEPGSLDVIAANSRVLVVGAGLTAVDILSSFLRRGHLGELLAISRRGLRPRSHTREIVDGLPGQPAPDLVQLELNGPIPEFIAREPVRARSWARGLRAEIRRQQAAGQAWQVPFDAVRDVVWKLWPGLPVAEKQRFLRRLSPFYDVHRFRTPPMNDALVRQAEAEGRVRFAIASIVEAEVIPEAAVIGVKMFETQTGKHLHGSYDYVVNCTGLDHASSWRTNPVLRSLVQQKLLTRHATGLGFEVGGNCEAIDAAGATQPNLRVIGPPTVGVFGDPLGAPFIAAQVQRMLPDLMHTLEVAVK
jgi:uncharacterized NAD(P)/FAD-binding protein YdhS